MARIVLGSYMVRYPLGGMMSWVLQWLVGFQRLGHDVHFVEKAGYPQACYDPVRNLMTDDCAYGTAAVRALLGRFGLGDRWCFVDAAGRYHGMARGAIEAVLASADVFVDMGTHGSWLPEAAAAGVRVLVDGEPGFTQMKMVNAALAGVPQPDYDQYFTTGQNIGTPASSSPTAGRSWRHVFHPVVPGIFEQNAAQVASPLGADPAPFTTVMNWQSYQPVEFDGATYRHKDVEFARFLDLPGRTSARLEAAVGGPNVPWGELARAGWQVRDAHEVTISFDAFRDYLGRSAGEFSVCKHGYVATRSGWFSDRSAAYLASARPVVMQETGFSDHLPVGRGLLAASTVEDAAMALDEISRDPAGHARAALEIAHEVLDARHVLGAFLDEVASTRADSVPGTGPERPR